MKLAFKEVTGLDMPCSVLKESIEMDIENNKKLQAENPNLTQFLKYKCHPETNCGAELAGSAGLTISCLPHSLKEPDYGLKCLHDSLNESKAVAVEPKKDSSPEKCSRLAYKNT